MSTVILVNTNNATMNDLALLKPRGLVDVLVLAGERQRGGRVKGGERLSTIYI